MTRRAALKKCSLSPLTSKRRCEALKRPMQEILRLGTLGSHARFLTGASE